jgi:SAM-dependent methyltransferase
MGTTNGRPVFGATDGRVVQAEFDQIALLPSGGFDNNAYYHGYLLGVLQPEMKQVLDIGCGTGQFTRLLAARAEQVLALDFSASMIAAAGQQSEGFQNITFIQADATTWDWPTERFDAIVTIATLHHLPPEGILPRMKAALRAGGTLVVLDIRRSSSLAEWLLAAIALPWSLLLHLVHTGRLRPERRVRQAWSEHGRNDRYLSLEDVRRICLPILPGAIVRRHLLWRYSLVWRKP